MGSQTKVEILSRNYIKPLSPTPPNNRILGFSLLDQAIPPMYTTIIFFYSNDNSTGDSSSQYLQKSLSKTLVHFYPFAGRVRDNTHIECNDQGAYFIEARIDFPLSDILEQPDPSLLGQFLPTSDPKFLELAATDVVSLVQLTEFSCGGIGIGVCASHKIADMSSLCAFVKSWGETAREDGVVESPEFVGASLLPPKDLLTDRAIPAPVGGPLLATRRYLFDYPKLANLKAKTSPSLQFTPTNVELVSAILLRCAVSASQSAGAPSVMFHGVNLRKRMVPPLRDNTIGNLVWNFPVSVEESDGIELDEILSTMRKEFAAFCNEKADRFRGEDGHSLIFETLRNIEEHARKGVQIYNCTSLCKFPYYEVDFGWGKPKWVTSPMFNNNVFVLMDRKLGEGIEAWVTLEEQKIAIFESNEELLSFASFKA
ncbi:Transferase [Trema orientale]|uniref:Transferase n=1 Tax=Trema orientale TaxID=63057 RepID=A0A2P5EMG6_TREOI|nr:Transferase [Trema orientale]